MSVMLIYVLFINIRISVLLIQRTCVTPEYQLYQKVPAHVHSLVDCQSAPRSVYGRTPIN